MCTFAALYFTLRIKRGIGGHARQRLHSCVLANFEARCRILAITCGIRHLHWACLTYQGHGGVGRPAHYRCFDLETGEEFERGRDSVPLDRLSNVYCCSRMRLALRASMDAFWVSFAWGLGAAWAGRLVAGSWLSNSGILWPVWRVVAASLV